MKSTGRFIRIFSVAIIVLMFNTGCCNGRTVGGESLPLNIEILEDENGSISFDDILAGKHTFRKIQENNLNLGFTYSTLWVRISSADREITDGDYVFVYNQSWTKKVDAYIRSGKGYTIYRAGNENGFSARPLPDLVFAFPVTVKDGSADMFLKLNSNYRIVLDFRLMKTESFWERISVAEPFYAVLAAFLIYNLILFFFIRGMEYLYYCGFLFTFLVFLLAFDGTGFMYLWQNSPGWDDFALTGMLILQSFWVIPFFIKFTGSAEVIPRATNFLRLLALLTIPAASLKIFFPAKNVLLWTMPFLQLIAVALISISLYMAVKGSRSAAYFLISFIVLLGFSLLNSFVAFGLIGENFIVHFGMHTGASICAITFSLGMADRINAMRISGEISARTVKIQNLKLERANEELDATNQELQAAMEELEATNGGMQAILEELQGSNQLLWNSEQRLSGILRYAPIGISLFDPAGNITQINDYALKMLGYGRDEILGRSFQSITHPDDYSKGRDLFDQLMSGKIENYRYDKRYLRKDGSEWWADVSTSALKSETGKITAMIGIAIDISEKIEAQNEHDRIQDQLWQSQKLEAVGTLAGGIAHDFNNILTAIIGYTELAISGVKDGGNSEECLQQVKSASMRAKDLVRRILTLSRSGDNIKAPHRLLPIIGDSVRMIRATTPSTIEIIFRYDSGDKAVLCDSTQIQQVLLNLFTNANYAMKEKGGELSVIISDVNIDRALAALHKVGEGEYIRIIVADTGTGMNRDILERIFDPFFTTKAPGIGTGLGLSVARGIILDHGGFITAESEEGIGSRFCLYLPVTSAAEAEVSGRIGDAVIRGGNERLLVVDDEHIIAEMTRLLLQKFGYIVRTAPGGLEALELFRSSPGEFDLIITDQIMPRMTGLALAKEIKKIRPDIPVILCTGYSDTADPYKARELGITEFLSKPVINEDLAEAIRRALDEMK